jgi:protein-L-isoaspartate(D-aspartate) O-methyltransferase
MNFSEARMNMVESQVRPNGITDPRIIDAMAGVHREDFVPAARKNIAYLDGHILLRDGRYLMEPMAFGRLVHAAAIKPTDKVLIVGAATGYGAAVVSQLAAETTALECDPELAAAARANLAEASHVRVVEGVLAAGSPSHGPFDVIILEGRVTEIPQTLLTQLADGGRAVAAIGGGNSCAIKVISFADGTCSSRSLFDASVHELPGFPLVRPAFVF